MSISPEFKPSVFLASTRFGLGINPAMPFVVDEHNLVNIMLSGFAKPAKKNSDSSTPARLLQEIQFRKERRENIAKQEALKIPNPPVLVNNIPAPYQVMKDDVKRRTSDAVNIPPQDAFVETFIRFMSNSISVSVSRSEINAVAVPYEDEAIRPYVNGTFEDVLIATACHPAMLLYLDAASSVGENSPAGGHGKHGINENYAREVMELHTLGVNGGYSQNDIRELAMALSGFGVDKENGSAVFRQNRHEPGSRNFMGNIYPQTDQSQAIAMLKFLSNHIMTAKRFCSRLAVHYLGKNPPQIVVDGMIARWRATHGNLKEVCGAMLSNSLSWNSVQTKFKTPDEFVISSARLFSLNTSLPKVQDSLPYFLRRLSMYPFTAASPQGYMDDERWLSPEGMMERASVASDLASLCIQRGGADPRLLTEMMVMGDNSTRIIRAAPSVHDGLALVLLAPEFQRR